MKVLLISDATMNVNEGGLSQTLYNLFSFLPPGNILCITSRQAFTNSPPTPPYASRYLTYPFNYIPIPKNRFAKYVTASINWLNYTGNYLRSYKSLRAQIKVFDPGIIVTCPNGPEALFMHYRLQSAFSNKKVVPYFMDDWLHQSRLTWMGNNIQRLAKNILTQNPDWMMISKALGNILSTRYLIKPHYVLEIHNPVYLSGVPEPYVFQKKEAYTIAYAGALWPMHFDAFLVMAKAVALLKKQRKITLLLYTKKSQWEWRKKYLEPLQVEYGGNIPYNQIHRELAKADGLLVTSSFSEEWKTHSLASVQTKLTDYLKAGRLIIACGPAYSANNTFLQLNKCGVCIETDDVQKAATELQNILEHLELNQAYVQHGYDVLKSEFSFEVVHEKLKQFLSSC